MKKPKFGLLRSKKGKGGGWIGENVQRPVAPVATTLNAQRSERGMGRASWRRLLRDWERGRPDLFGAGFRTMALWFDVPRHVGRKAEASLRTPKWRRRYQKRGRGRRRERFK